MCEPFTPGRSHAILTSQDKMVCPAPERFKTGNLVNGNTSRSPGSPHQVSKHHLSVPCCVTGTQAPKKTRQYCRRTYYPTLPHLSLSCTPVNRPPANWAVFHLLSGNAPEGTQAIDRTANLRYNPVNRLTITSTRDRVEAGLIGENECRLPR